MKIGVQLPEVEREVRWPEIRRMAVAIEDHGFDSIWVGDHLLYRANGERGPWEAWSTLAAVAAVTSRVELGPLVAATSFHAPAMIAKKAVTVDEISGGRLILGLGAGWNRVEYEAFGYPYDHRVSRFAEAFEIIRRLVGGERVTFRGRYYETDDAVILPRGPRSRIPILLGSNGPRMLALAGPHIDAWNTWYASYGNRPEGLAPLVDRVSGLLGEAGRSKGEVAMTAAVLVQMPGGDGRPVSDPSKATEPLTGTPQQIAEALKDWQALGIDEIQLVLDPITLESIEWVAEVRRRLIDA